MRIVSLVPSATETLFALGVGSEVAAVTHECDYPADVLNLPKVTRDVIGPGLAPDEIDRAVRTLTEQGRSIYELDEEGLRRLQPDLIVTQALCTVCAVSVDDVRAIAERMDPVPKIVSLDPHTIGEVLGDVRSLAQATDRKDAGVELVAGRRRADRPRAAGDARGAERVRVAMLEWLDPIFVGGHWVPQLIELRRRRGPARPAGRAVRAALVGGGRGRQAAGRDRRAVRLRRRARLRGGARRTATSWPRSAPSGSSSPTPPPGSHAPARAWSRASSGSATCCTPTGCRSRRAASATSISARRGDDRARDRARRP